MRLFRPHSDVDSGVTTLGDEHATERIAGRVGRTHHQLVTGRASAPIIVKIFRLPIEEWSSLSRKVQKNDLKIFDGFTVSILRNDREVFAGGLTKLTTQHSVTLWYRVQIDFPGVLDEAFGVASNKQGVRMKDYVLDAIKAAIGLDITKLNDEIKRFQAEKVSQLTPAKPTASQQRANEVDHFHAKPLDAALTESEKEQLDADLRGLGCDSATRGRNRGRGVGAGEVVEICHRLQA